MVHIVIIIIFVTDKSIIMVIVSSREFRANQRKYFDLAKSNDVVITSRNHGNYRLIPVSKQDRIVDGNSRK